MPRDTSPCHPLNSLRKISENHPVLGHCYPYWVGTSPIPTFRRRRLRLREEESVAPSNTHGLRRGLNPGLSGPQAERFPEARPSRGSWRWRGEVKGRGWRPGEVAAPSPSRCCCCCRRGGGWGTLCAMGVMAAVGYMAAETGSETQGGAGVRPVGSRCAWGRG